MYKYLEYKDDKSNKFWEVTVTGNSYTIRYGKIGTEGQSKTKEFSSEEEALKDAEKLAASKVKKGYVDNDDINSLQYLELKEKYQKIFEESLKKYTGQYRHLFDLKKMEKCLLEKFPEDFKNWINPVSTGIVKLSPITEINIEIGISGDAYVQVCTIDENLNGYVPQVEDIGFDYGDIEIEVSKSNSFITTNLIPQFYTAALFSILPELCKTNEFLELPREKKIKITCRSHSGWSAEDAYIYEGKRNLLKINNNILLAEQLKSGCRLITLNDNDEVKFINELKALDMKMPVSEFEKLFNEFFEGKADLVKGHGPFKFFIADWDPKLKKSPVFGMAYNDTSFRWKRKLNEIYSWLPKTKIKLNKYQYINARDAVTYKLAEIACRAMLKVEKTELFINLPKDKNFNMLFTNRTNDYQKIVFYYFNK